MVDVEGNGDDGLSGLVEKEYLSFTGIVNGDGLVGESEENYGDQVMGGSEENNADRVVVESEEKNGDGVVGVSEEKNGDRAVGESEEKNGDRAVGESEEKNDDQVVGESEEKNGDQVVGESEENNGDDLVANEEGGKGKGKEVEEHLVEEEVRAEENKDGEEVGNDENKSEENGVLAVVGTGGLELEADKNGKEAIDKNVEAAEDAKGNENSGKKVDENSTQRGRKPKKRIRKKKAVQRVLKAVSKDEDKPESSAKKKVVKKIVSKNEDKPESSAQKKIVKTIVIKNEDKPESSAKKEVVKKIVSKNDDKPESSAKRKKSKKVESMGMIFMCTSQTKKDCYRYKLLGLPAGKKELVEKIYKGMRLFLFDLDLRLLYGIYKAAAPGGTNIEPQAFKSAFPSQVRFTVLEDCLPLAEEKFKEAIKENYYSRNKFDCQLNSEQVKKLCKLFVSVSKGSALQNISRSLVVGSASEGLKQQTRDEKRGLQVGCASDGLKQQSRDEKRGRKRRDRDEGSSRKQRDRDEERGRKRRGRREERKSPPRREQRHQERPVIYANEVPYSQVAPLHGVYQLPAPVYAYERTLEMNPYRREPVLEHHGLQIVDRAPRHRDETKNIDPYISYREREGPSFRRPIYSPASEREYYTPAVLPAAYLPAGRDSEHQTTSRLRDYYQPGTLPPEYLPSRREIEYRPSRREVEYRTTAELPAEYRLTRALPAEYHASRSLLAEYRAAGLPTEDLAPAGASNGYHQAGPAVEYRSSAGGLRDYRSLQTMQTKARYR